MNLVISRDLWLDDIDGNVYGEDEKDSLNGEEIHCLRISAILPTPA